MNTSIDDQVIDFYEKLFERIFSESFRPAIEDRRKRNTVIRQVQESADASSQSLTRFFANQQLSEDQVANILIGFSTLDDHLKLDDISSANIMPESVVDDLLPNLPCPDVVQQAGHDAVYRVALHSVVQVLMFVGPVMAEWQRLNFSSNFELPRQVVNRLNKISAQLDVLGRSGQDAADERYELIYRDYILQRFYRVEAGTVRMTTNMNVDLRELFVMPHIHQRPLPKKGANGDSTDTVEFMNLEVARKRFSEGRNFFGEDTESEEKKDNKEDKKISAFDQVKQYPRNVIIGIPGSGKSTFFEWLQLKVAAAKEELVMDDGQQAIPLLLRVRQLDIKNLPLGAELIEKAIDSKDRAGLMPTGWIKRQMENGRILFMLDGLDETEPELRDKYLFPWFSKLCKDYPKCRFLLSSRPVGYPVGIFRKFEFVECDLLDFTEEQVREYTRHWCTAVCLAQNEPEKEARQKGVADGDLIVEGFKTHPYICDLAHNPLMLSAICLVNYFERGKLPEDRVLLYKLCVEGLLHHWDQRRGIHSQFTLDEKLRTCREVALAMQADDRAEYEAVKVQAIFTDVLGDPARAQELLEHIRYRTGLLLERRPGVFAFAHLTFQEYLAARAVHEGNKLKIDAEKLCSEWEDPRWKEVIPLYCGLTTTPAARDMIECLMAQPDKLYLSNILAEAYLSSGQELAQDKKFRKKVLERIAVLPYSDRIPLNRFTAEEVAPIANMLVSRTKWNDNVSETYIWLAGNSKFIEIETLSKRLQGWQEMTPIQVTELVCLLHMFVPDMVLCEIAKDTVLYRSPGVFTFKSQAELALFGLLRRDNITSVSPGFDAAFLQIIRVLSCSKIIGSYDLERLLDRLLKSDYQPQNAAVGSEFITLTRKLADHFEKMDVSDTKHKDCIEKLRAFADMLENSYAGNK